VATAPLPWDKTVFRQKGTFPFTDVGQIWKTHGGWLFQSIDPEFSDSGSFPYWSML